MYFTAQGLQQQATVDIDEKLKALAGGASRPGVRPGRNRRAGERKKKSGREPHRTPVVPVNMRGGISRSRLTLDTCVPNGHLALDFNLPAGSLKVVQ